MAHGKSRKHDESEPNSAKANIKLEVYGTRQPFLKRKKTQQLCYLKINHCEN